MGLSRLFRRRPQVAVGSEFGHAIKQFRLRVDGLVEYAQWLHPSETQKSVTQEAVNALREFVAPGDFVIDIGAHTGDTTVPLAIAAGVEGMTLALEPNPFVYKILAANARLNPTKTNIDARPYAATSSEGLFTFHYSDGGYCNGGFRTQQRSRMFRKKYPLDVQGRNLQKVLDTEFADWLPRLSYVKVDAEGYDRVVLESIAKTLKEHRPIIVSEVYRKLVRAERLALFDFLDTLGYRIHLQVEEKSVVGDEVTRRAMCERKHFDIVAVPRPARMRSAA